MLFHVIIDSLVSFKLSPKVTQHGDHVTDEDIEDVENQGSQMGQVQDSNAAGRTRRNSCNPICLTSNMIVAYTLPVI